MYDPNAGAGQMPLLSRLLGGIFGSAPGVAQAPAPQVNQPSAAPQVQTPGTIGGAMRNSGFGINMDTGNFLLGGLQSLGNLWAANKAYGLAKDQFGFQKEVTNTNLNNQIQSYNTSLEDRARARAVLENRDPSSADEYIDRNRLTR